MLRFGLNKLKHNDEMRKEMKKKKKKKGKRKCEERIKKEEKAFFLIKKPIRKKNKENPTIVLPTVKTMLF